MSIYYDPALKPLIKEEVENITTIITVIGSTSTIEAGAEADILQDHVAAPNSGETIIQEVGHKVEGTDPDQGITADHAVRKKYTSKMNAINQTRIAIITIVNAITRGTNIKRITRRSNIIKTKINTNEYHNATVESVVTDMGRM